MKSNRLKYLSIIALIFCCFMPAHAETAAEYLARCSAKLKNASSVNASFTMRTAQGNTKGTLLCKGSKFAVTMQGAGTWYDGKDMWTYSAQNGEATVWRPTQAELRESNPLLYLSTSKDYSVKWGGGATKAGEKTLILTPLKRSSGVKSVSIVINSSTLLPKSITISASGGSYGINISLMKLGGSVPDSSFRFNKSKYPGVSICDLR